MKDIGSFILDKFIIPPLETLGATLLMIWIVCWFPVPIVPFMVFFTETTKPEKIFIVIVWWIPAIIAFLYHVVCEWRKFKLTPNS